MLKMNLDTDINNIFYLQYMEEQEEKIHQKQNNNLETEITTQDQEYKTKI